MSDKSIVVKEHFEEQAMSLERLTGQMTIIQGVMKGIMKPGEHYGTIPGCGPKPGLFKPGAEKLCVTFRLAPSYEIKKTILPDDHREYEIVCTLTHISSGAVIGQGLGSCSTLESKYRYRNAPLKCPNCSAEDTIIKGKAEYGGGWLCFGKKGGCGAKFKDSDPQIKNQERGRTEHTDPADHYNTVLKMGKKRAMIDAVLTATAASDIFSAGPDDPRPPDDPPDPDEMPSATDYKRLYAIGASNKVSKGEITEIAGWYRKGARLKKSELEMMILNFKEIFDQYLKTKDQP